MLRVIGQLDAERSLVEIDDAELHHLTRVRLARPGDSFEALVEGQGWFSCRLEKEGRRWWGSVTGTIGQRGESPLQIELGLAMIKRDRFDWAVQKATELGVTAIHPLETQHSEVRLKQPEKLQQRWQRIARESVKQCGRSVVPGISSPVSIQSCLEGFRGDLTVVLDENWDPALAQPTPSAPKRCLILVGPQGGWSTQEGQFFSESQAHRIWLGRRILRAETAPIVAITLLQARWGEWAEGTGLSD